MNILITSCNYDNYKPLADLTWPNKISYCQKYGYQYLHKVDNFIGNGMVMGFEKIHYILELIKTREYDWIWFVGCDTLITNYSIKIEDIINEYGSDSYFLITKDINGLNADSFLVRCDSKGQEFFEYTFLKQKELNNIWPYEQGVWWSEYEKRREGIKIIPQNLINAYEYSLYGMTYSEGEWDSNSLLMHWPGLDLKTRLQLFEKYSKLIKY